MGMPYAGIAVQTQVRKSENIQRGPSHPKYSIFITDNAQSLDMTDIIILLATISSFLRI